jgi:SulP family sulfate permease
VYVLASGRLRVETVTDEERGCAFERFDRAWSSARWRCIPVSRAPRTWVAETPSVVLKLSKDSIERMEAEDPELAAALHRWLATTVAGRLGESLKAFDALFDWPGAVERRR